jgi:RND family efflux transporter MFP subunit
MSVRFDRSHPDARDERKDLGGGKVRPPRSFRLETRPQDDVASKGSLLSLFLLLAPLLLTACHKAASEQVEATAPVPVAVQAARQGAIHSTFSASGLIKPAAGAELIVTAPQSARIAAMPRGIGEKVRRGELLVRFEIPALESDAAARRADQERARARLTLAHSNFDRLQGLFERGIAARKEVEDARRELTDAEAGVGEAQSALAAAGRLAGREVVRAPFAGVVAERTHNPGDLVEPGPDPILRLMDPARLQVETALPVDQLILIPVGSPARILGPNGAVWQAHVITQPAAVDPATTTATLVLAFTAPPNLPAGTPVQVEIAGAEHRDAVLVPAAAIVQEGPESFVYTVDAQHHTHRAAVRVGIAGGAEVEILTGLTPSTQVIVEGQNGLPDGAAVVVQKPGEQP